jgi:hypothetical protein
MAGREISTAIENCNSRPREAELADKAEALPRIALREWTRYSCV